MRSDGVQPVISVSGVSVPFGLRRVLNLVDLEVYPGELVALVGENGAGKTTLVGCVTGSLTSSTAVTVISKWLRPAWR